MGGIGGARSEVKAGILEFQIKTYKSYQPNSISLTSQRS